MRRSMSCGCFSRLTALRFTSFEENKKKNIFQISSWGVCIKFKVLIILVWLRGRAQNDDKLTNAKLYPPHVDFIKKLSEENQFHVLLFPGKTCFLLFHPPRVRGQSGTSVGCGFDCCVHLPYINIARTCRPPPCSERVGGFLHIPLHLTQ